MKKLTAQEGILIKKYKRNVYKQFPNAHLHLTPNGYYTIVQEMEDLTYKDILFEYCFPPTSSELEAWKVAERCSKVNQNINRTHPLKVEASDIISKLERIENRRLKNANSKENRKMPDLDIY